MSDMSQEIPENAVSVYGEDNALDDFPVLKAFQQYVDAEQAKARKRMLMLCVFFGVLMIVVISVFVILLIGISSRNQALNDRLIEYAMKDRDRQSGGSAVVVQPPQDSSAILAMTAKLDEMQKKLAESQARAEKIAADAAEKAEQAAIEAAKPKGPTPEEREIERLKALLAAEKEKQSVEREKQHQAEIEAYRRKHYPELYETKTPKPKPAGKPVRKVMRDEDVIDDDLLDEVDRILDDGDAISYYEEDDESEGESRPSSSIRRKRTPVREGKPKRVEPDPEPQKEYSIPVDVKGSSTRWSIPSE